MKIDTASRNTTIYAAVDFFSGNPSKTNIGEGLQVISRKNLNSSFVGSTFLGNIALGLHFSIGSMFLLTLKSHQPFP